MDISRISEILRLIVEHADSRDFRIDPSHDKSFILRHDVDSSLMAANEFSNILINNGIKSNFFIRTNGNLYNPVSYSSRKILDSLAAHHNVGLHIESPANFSSQQEFEFEFTMQIELLEKLIGKRIIAVSWHRPNSKDLAGIDKINGYINLYSKKYFQEYEYISDSANMWSKEREARLLASLNSKVNIQLLLHAEWWLSIDGASSFTKSIASQISIMRQELENENAFFSSTYTSEFLRDF